MAEVEKTITHLDKPGEHDHESYNKSTPKAVPIVMPHEGKFKFDGEALKQIIASNEAENLPVAVVSIAGAFRKGKSFLLNLFLRYLEAENKSLWLSSLQDCLLGFSWRGGAERETTGILVWDNIYKVKTSDGSKVAILIMDTQGAFDGDSSVKEYATIFALSTLLSSVQIYNLSQQIQEDDLHQLELFLEYGKLATQTSNQKPFQSLMFLIRDWSYPYEHPYGVSGGTAFLKEKVGSKNKHPQLAKVREHISSYFEDMLCYLMPHPGLKVACNPNFKGAISDIELEFQEHICQLIPLILSPENLKTKKVGGDEISCNEFVMYFQSYTKVYNGDDLPPAKTVLEATIEASTMATVKRCAQSYSIKMERSCDRDGSYLQPKAFESLHQRHFDATLNQFDTAKKLGEDDTLFTHREQLISNLNQLYEEFKAKNGAKKVVCNTRTPLVLIGLIVVSYTLSSLFMALWFSPIADIFTYCMWFGILGLLCWLHAWKTGENQIMNEILDRICKSVWEEICLQIFNTALTSLPNHFAQKQS